MGPCDQRSEAPLNVTTSDHLLAGNGAFHDEILARFAEIFRGHQRIPLPPLPAAH